MSRLICVDPATPFVVVGRVPPAFRAVATFDDNSETDLTDQLADLIHLGLQVGTPTRGGDGTSVLGDGKEPVGRVELHGLEGGETWLYVPFGGGPIFTLNADDVAKVASDAVAHLVEAGIRREAAEGDDGTVEAQIVSD